MQALGHKVCHDENNDARAREFLLKGKHLFVLLSLNLSGEIMV